MKNYMCVVFILFLCSCDPDACSEYLIKNSTNLDLNLTFIEKKEIKEVNIEKQYVVNFIEHNCDTGGAPLLYLYNYNSIYLSKGNEILKVWKPDTKGKNIYNIDKDWSVRESPKDNFIYTFEITDEDLIRQEE